MVSSMGTRASTPKKAAEAHVMPPSSRLAPVRRRAYAWGVRLDAPILLAAALLLSACEQGPAPREWRPEDHQPPGGGADPSQAEPSEAAGTADAGAALWRLHCASCHGAQGRGDGPAAPPVATIPDLTSAEARARTDEEMAAVIREGRGMMPGFGSRLSEQGIAALVAHMRSFGSN